MNRTLEPTVLALAALISGGRVLADVTIQQQTTIHVFIVKAHGMSTDRIAGDKQRNETQFSCDGIMSMFCGHNKAVDIVRVDRGVTWKIEPSGAKICATHGSCVAVSRNPIRRNFPAPHPNFPQWR
jgi:hypothetical protein